MCLYLKKNKLVVPSFKADRSRIGDGSGVGCFDDGPSRLNEGPLFEGVRLEEAAGRTNNTNIAYLNCFLIILLRIFKLPSIGP